MVGPDRSPAWRPGGLGRKRTGWQPIGPERRTTAKPNPVSFQTHQAEAAERRQGKLLPQQAAPGWETTAAYPASERTEARHRRTERPKPTEPERQQEPRKRHRTAGPERQTTAKPNQREPRTETKRRQERQTSHRTEQPKPNHRTKRTGPEHRQERQTSHRMEQPKRQDPIEPERKPAGHPTRQPHQPERRTCPWWNPRILPRPSWKTRRRTCRTGDLTERFRKFRSKPRIR